MKLLKSTSCLFALIFAIASIFGLAIGLPLLLFCLGLREIFSSIEYFNNHKKHWAYAALCVGIFACICAALSLLKII